MKKDFDGWNQKKKRLHDRDEAPFFHAREIWWCSLGVNIGFEQDGANSEYSRPVVILKGMSRQTCFVIPLTTSLNNHPLRPSVGSIKGKLARALLSQMRLIDAKRLIKKIGYLNEKVFMRIRKAAKDML